MIKILLIVLVPALFSFIIGAAMFKRRVGGVYFAILTIAFCEFARIGFDHLKWVGGSSGLFLPVANYTRNDLWNLRGNPTMFYYIMLIATIAALAFCRIRCTASPGAIYTSNCRSPLGRRCSVRRCARPAG